MQDLSIKFGVSRVEGDLPAGSRSSELNGRFMAAIDNPLGELRRVLNEPVDDPPLREAVRDARNVLITVSDHTRYYGYEVWLGELLNQLNRGGIDDGRISLYVASGTHRQMTADEKVDRFSSEVCNRVEILDHDCDAQDRMMKVGRTDYGTTVWVDKRVYNADFLLITGGINYHYFAGYSGGRKSLLPGVCSRKSILINHLRALDRDKGEFAECVEPGRAIGNPVHEDMHEVSMLLKPDYCINVVLDANLKLAWFGAGDYAYVHKIGADWLDHHNKVELEEQASAAIIGAGGYPKDLSLFQAHKSLRHSVPALKPGATVIWIAACDEGEGPDDMAHWRNMTLDKTRLEVQHAPTLVSFCALSLKQITSTFNVHMVTNLNPEIARGWGITPHRTLAKAVMATEAGAGTDWLVARDMSNLLPSVKPKTSEDNHD